MTLVNTPAASVRAANDTPTSYEEFLDVLAGLRLSSSRIDIDIDRGQVTLDGRDAGLSAKEHDLLAHLAANADRSVTRDELFASVWADSELGSDSRTVDAHIRRLRKKLSILPDLISTVRGEGYRFNSTPSVRVRVTRPVTLAACLPSRRTPPPYPAAPPRASAQRPPKAAPSPATRTGHIKGERGHGLVPETAPLSGVCTDSLRSRVA